MQMTVKNYVFQPVEAHGLYLLEETLLLIDTAAALI